MSGLFASLGLALSYYVWSTTKNAKLTSGVFFFFTMEFLQFIQYFWLNQCDSMVNKVLTLLGFLHICLQVRDQNHVPNCQRTVPPTTPAMAPRYCTRAARHARKPSRAMLAPCAFYHVVYE